MKNGSCFSCRLVRWIVLAVFAVIGLLAILAIALTSSFEGDPGKVVDEARKAGRNAESFVAADDDYFRKMDFNPSPGHDELPFAVSAQEFAKTKEFTRGRNTWIVWTGGNDRLWDQISKRSFGELDFLKTLSSHRAIGYGRSTRWKELGLVNEPCFEEATGPDPERFGLWLDKRKPESAECPKDPFENESKYPGVRVGARGKKHLPVGSYYGYATGVVGLRLFPNPDFDDAARRKWDAERYYTDPEYYQDKKLVKPYRVGMSCAFCHVGPNPVNPPADPENPKWENLSSNVGAQYFWFDRIFAWRWKLEKKDGTRSFVHQLFRAARPGTLDTSLISSDNINNPRTMNAVYSLWPRLVRAKDAGRERLGGGSLDNRQFNEFDIGRHRPLNEFFVAPDMAFTPRVLKDGADSVGALGALNRVFLNIGLFSEEWLLHFKPLVGGKRVTPIEIAVARRRSSYWEATEAQTPDLALFFVASTAPHKLKDAPGGESELKKDADKVGRGKEVFAENCLRCHSSKQPPVPPEVRDPGTCAGNDYLVCWKNWWDWTQKDDFKAKAREIVRDDKFLKDNYLSSEFRVPVTLLQTNACSPLASNAIKGNIWDNFSSKTYKELPRVGDIRVYDSLTGKPGLWKETPAGGRGYTRPASLVSLWSTAPFLLNNSVGKFEWSPSVAARMKSFDDSIEKMLWPEKREREKSGLVPGMMDRTDDLTYLKIPAGYLPGELRLISPLFPWLLEKNGGIRIGPIPEGTPVNLLANTGLLSESSNLFERAAHGIRVAKLLFDLKRALRDLDRRWGDKLENLSADEKQTVNAEARKLFEPLVGRLLEFSKCPDFVVNRGHYFGTGYVEPGADGTGVPAGLSEADKRALIAFLKTF